MEVDDEITKEGEDADEEDEEEDTKLTIEEEPGQPVKNKRKNFQPRSIVTDEVNRLEKNRRKGATTPQKCLKPGIMDLSYRESETDSDTSENSKTVNLKNFRKGKTPNKCHVDRGSLLSLLNSDSRLNNPFGIDLSKFTRPGSTYGDVLAGIRKNEGEVPIAQPGTYNKFIPYEQTTPPIQLIFGACILHIFSSMETVFICLKTNHQTSYNRLNFFFCVSGELLKLQCLLVFFVQIWLK